MLKRFNISVNLIHIHFYYKLISKGNDKRPNLLLGNLPVKNKKFYLQSHLARQRTLDFILHC
jgi:hypothetical protein